MNKPVQLGLSVRKLNNIVIYGFWCDYVNIRKTKEVQRYMFSCEFWEICKNTCFVEHLRTAAFGNILLKHDAKKQK